MVEQLIPEAFANEFFLEIVRTYKHHKHIKYHEEKKKIQVKNTESSLINEAEKIQALEEMQVPVPTPTLSKEQKTLASIAPKTPVFHEIHVPTPPKLRQVFMDLGRLNAFVADKNVTLIQCDGPGMPIKINRKNKTLKTNISLKEQEIRVVLQKFSSRSQTHLTEPIFRAQVQDLAITAVISPVSLRFILVRK